MNVKKCDDLSIRFDTVPTLDRQTDRQADRIGKTISHAACIECWRAIKKQRLLINKR